MVELKPDQQAFLAECEQEFANRYTAEDAEYKATYDAKIPQPPIMTHWYPRGKRGHGGRGGGGRYRDFRDYRSDQRRDHDRSYDRHSYDDNRWDRGREDHYQRDSRERDDYRGRRAYNPFR